MSTRRLGELAGISHTQVRRIEAGMAPRVDLDVLCRMASVLGAEMSLGLHPVATPVRDAAHLALLGRFSARLAATLRWRTEVPMPMPGDLRAADGLVAGSDFRAVVEAETRLGDVQAVERRGRRKVCDLEARRLILLVSDTRHNRRVVSMTPELSERFPISQRAALANLARGLDPAGDCVVIL